MTETKATTAEPKKRSPNAAAMRQRYHHRKANNQCVHCENVPESGRVACSGHLIQLRNRSRRTKGMSRAQFDRMQAGLCVWCGIPRGDNGTSRYCAGHAQIVRDHVKARRIKMHGERRCYCGASRENSSSRKYCSDCHRKRLEGARLWRYGITSEQYAAVFAAQNGRCAICDRRETRRQLSIDHCHKSGLFRGLLCATCNQALGMLRDDPRLLIKAASYLSRAFAK